MITKYNPMHAPDPEKWKALDEQERIELALEYHSRADVELPNPHLHSIIHAVVEYQIALGDEYPVQKTLNRLIQEGLSRHDAIHAIGSVLVKYLIGENKSVDISNDYTEEVSQLTAQKWLDEFE